MKINIRYGSLTAAAALAAFAVPHPAFAQEEGSCDPRGNSLTRGAEIELSYSQRSDDTQPKQERYRRAIQKAEEAMSEDSTLGAAYLYAGMAHLGLNHYEQARAMFDRLAELEPDCSQVAEDYRYNAWVELYNRGIQQYQQGDQQAALESFETANLIYEDSRSLGNAASIYQTMGQSQKAIELYKRVLALGGEPQMVRAASINMAELLRQEGRGEEAVQIYAEFAAANPEDVVARLNYAIALMDAGQPDSAQAIFSELMARDDLTFEQWSEVGIGLYRAEDFGRAAEAFARAHEMRPLSKEILENLANSLYMADRYQPMLPLADTLVARYPLESRYYSMLANAYRETGQAERALETLQRRDSLQVEVTRVQLVPQPDSTYVVRGQLIGRTAAPGARVVIPFEFLDAQGETVASDTVTVAVPAEGQPAPFELALATDAPLAGFRYGRAEVAAGAAGAGSAGAAGAPTDETDTPEQDAGGGSPAGAPSPPGGGP